MFKFDYLKQVWCFLLYQKVKITRWATIMNRGILVSIAVAHKGVSTSSDRIWFPAMQVPVTAGSIGGTAEITRLNLLLNRRWYGSLLS